MPTFRLIVDVHLDTLEEGDKLTSKDAENALETAVNCLVFDGWEGPAVLEGVTIFNPSKDNIPAVGETSLG